MDSARKNSINSMLEELDQHKGGSWFSHSGHTRSYIYAATLLYQLHNPKTPSNKITLSNVLQNMRNNNYYCGTHENKTNYAIESENNYFQEIINFSPTEVSSTGSQKYNMNTLSNKFGNCTSALRSPWTNLENHSPEKIIKKNILERIKNLQGDTLVIAKDDVKANELDTFVELMGEDQDIAQALKSREIKSLELMGHFLEDEISIFFYNGLNHCDTKIDNLIKNLPKLERIVFGNQRVQARSPTSWDYNGQMILVSTARKK